MWEGERAVQGCSPSRYRVLMQTEDIRKSNSSWRSVFKSAQVLTVLPILKQDYMKDMTANQRCGLHFSWLNGSSHQLPLAKPHENKRSNLGRLHSMLWCWSLPSHKPGMSRWAKDKCVLTAKNEEKTSWVFLGGNRNWAPWAQSSLVCQARGAEHGKCPLLPTVLRRSRLHAL